MTEDDDLAALREQTAHGDRIEDATTDDATYDLVAAILDELAAIDAGDKQKTVSVWDGHLAAFIRALENDPDQLTAVGHALQRRLDREPSEVDRSELLRLALRLGFQEAAPDEFDALREAARERAIEEL